LPDFEKFNFYFESYCDSFKADFIRFSTFGNINMLVDCYNNFRDKVKKVADDYNIPEIRYTQLIKRDFELDYALTKVMEIIELENRL
jgi:hypothetical protein